MSKPINTDCFQLKADFLPVTVFQLLRPETELLQRQLEQLVQQAPQYFNNTPVVVDCTEPAIENSQFDIKQLCELLRQYRMQPIAARGLITQDVLPVLSESAKKQSSSAQTKESLKTGATVVTKPVRGGTQIYAKDSDLILLAPVNAGAEVIADGHIHIYAPLRGRALAGATGDTNARIFCDVLEAELISIAGMYLTSEKLKGMNISGSRVHVFLRENKLCVEAMRG